MTARRSPPAPGVPGYVVAGWDSGAVHESRIDEANKHSRVCQLPFQPHGRPGRARGEVDRGPRRPAKKQGGRISRPALSAIRVAAYACIKASTDS